jgi:hypothetical protein
VLPAYARPMLENWRKHRALYACEPGNNDDWYWLHAAVKCGGAAPASGPDRGVWVVTNDEMRDHNFQMLSGFPERAFLRWRERHQVPFNLDDQYSSEARSRRHAAAPGSIERAAPGLRLEPPLEYSQRIQSRVLTADGGGRGGWHVPVDDRDPALRGPQGAAHISVRLGSLRANPLEKWLCVTDEA